MIVISFQFLAGRYHATPWGRHVNEGAVEWPPSPWRILRALVATWKRTLPELAEEDVKPIFETLAKLPEFVLPAAATGHTRHYMPWHKGWKQDAPLPRTKVFDTFVALGSDARLLARWPDASLSAAQRTILASILANLGTLGRAESWCSASLEDDETVAQSMQGASMSVPVTQESLVHNEDLVRVLCPDPSSAFTDEFVVRKASTSTGRGASKVVSETRSSIYDPSWNMCMETLQLHKERWSDPPGSVWVQYTRSRNCFNIDSSDRRGYRAPVARPQLVRFALDSTVLPLATETLPVAEAARRALIYRLAGVRGQERYGHAWSREQHKAGVQPVSLDSVLSGKDASGAPRQGHAHAYFLPSDEDGDGRLDHLTVFARDGFDPSEMQAMDGLRVIRPHGQDNTDHPLRVLLVGASRISQPGCRLVDASQEWISVTPYLATRHAKARGRDRIEFGSLQAKTEFLMADLRTQLGLWVTAGGSGLPDVEIEPLMRDGCFRVANRWSPIQFNRQRAKQGDDGHQRLAGAFRIKFSHEQCGPIALGFGSHFGLGLFVPAG